MGVPLGGHGFQSGGLQKTKDANQTWAMGCWLETCYKLDDMTSPTSGKIQSSSYIDGLYNLEIPSFGLVHVWLSLRTVDLQCIHRQEKTYLNQKRQETNIHPIAFFWALETCPPNIIIQGEMKRFIGLC